MTTTHLASDGCPGVYRDPSAARSLGAGAQSKALLLDRDGVINVNHGYVHTPQDTDFIDGIFELCRAAQQAGYVTIVVTNQAGIARGFYSEAQFLDYTQWLHAEFANRGVPLLATYYCPHHPDAGLAQYLLDCPCRKPNPGMLLQARSDYSIDVAASVMIGDHDSDLAAAHAAGVGTALKAESGELHAVAASLAGTHFSL